MKVFIALTWLIFAGLTSIAESNDDNKFRRGQYDYDIDGTRKDRIKHKISHGTIKVINAPYRITHKTYDGIRHVVRSTASHAEVFLTEAASLEGDKEHMRNIVRGWESSPALEEIMMKHRRQGHRFLFGLPHDAWVLLRNVLYTGGVRLPRAGYRALRVLVTGSLGL